MKKFLGEFKEFALRGNVMDLAIGVIIGAAFQAIVTSLTGDIISPLLGLFGQVNFDSLAITVGQATIRYGAFLTAVLNFVIMALVIFLFVKLTNKLSKWGKSQWRSKGCHKDLSLLLLRNFSGSKALSPLHFGAGQ